MIKNLFISFGYFLILFFSLAFVYTVINYFGLFSSSFNSYVKFLISIISVLVSSFILGKRSIRNGYVEGIKLGLLVILFFLIVTLFFSSFNVKTVFYYIILILFSCLGGMFGINKKKVSD